MVLDKIKVWVLAPIFDTDDPNLAYYSDYETAIAEYTQVFKELKLPWQWQPVRTYDYKQIIDGIANDKSEVTNVVLNLCDGDDVNGIPGISVIQYLTEKKMIFTGSDEAFYDITNSKITMKQAFDKANVPIPTWEALDIEGHNVAGIFDRLGKPLILKPAISAGSMGISVKSVVDTEGSLTEQIGVLNQGYRGWSLTNGGLFVEQFITGFEFTTFIVGNFDDAENAHIYPPIERVFNQKLPPKEQFLSFDRLWEFYEEEAPIGDDTETLWDYHLPPPEFVEDIKRVSWEAFKAVGGTGYGRVDLRMNKETKELYVLEINAQPGLSEDENFTSIGGILRFMEKPFSYIIKEIIETTLVKRGFYYNFNQKS